MKISKRQLRRIIKEAISPPTLNQWADQHDLIVDVDPLTGQDVVLIDDEFAMTQGLPNEAAWVVERSHDDSGWVVSTGGGPSEFEEFAAGDLSDLDDIGIQYRGY